MPQTELDIAKAELQKIQTAYIAELKELLKNPKKKEIKVLQAEAEDLYADFTQKIAKYKKNKIKELENKVKVKEETDLENLYNDLIQLQ